jgi:hypothetical protein
METGLEARQENEVFTKTANRSFEKAANTSSSSITTLITLTKPKAHKDKR